MKTTLLIAASSFLAGSSFGQNGIIWTSVSNESELQLIQTGNNVTSENQSIQSLIDNFNVQSFSKALPNSKKASLQQVYEITCICNEHELLQEVSRMPHIFTSPEIGPHYETLVEPNDYTLTFSPDYALDLINAQGAWDVTTGDSSVIIAISDQNFHVDHEELAGKVHFYDATNTADKTHGTAVAVSAAGNTNNALGKSAIGYNSELALYRMSYNDVLVATYSGSRVINMSWTSGCAPSSYVQGVMDEAYENGSIVVAAAGNGGTCGGPSSLVYPASCDRVIAVTSIGADDKHERIPGDTNSTHQHNPTVDIVAPGYAVPLTGAPGWYLTGNGSSFAAPLVSGTIALMLAVDPCLTFEDIETILYTSAADISELNPGYDGILGAGRLDAGAALILANTYNSCNPVEEEAPYMEDELEEEVANDDSVDEEEVSEEVKEEEAIFNDDTAEDLDNIKDPFVQGEQIAGVEENEAAAELSIYPNPSNAGSTITLKSDQLIESYDLIHMNGGSVKHIKVQSTEVLMNDLAPGVYMLKINMSSGETRTERVIVV